MKKKEIFYFKQQKKVKTKKRKILSKQTNNTTYKFCLADEKGERILFSFSYIKYLKEKIIQNIII